MSEIASIIKYEGDNSTFIWKHPCEDFNYLTQLIVHESQEAIFFLNGQALDLFGPGRHTLETQNIPLIGEALNFSNGNTSPFHCDVYFINKTEQMAIKWGTSSQVEYLEPTYNFPIAIGACGEMSLVPSNSRKLLLKLVGTEKVLKRDTLVDYFRAFLMTRIKTYIAQFMKKNSVNIFEIDEHLTEFSDALKSLLSKDFFDYGISLEKFLVTRVVKPEGNRQYDKFKELYFRQYADVAEAKLKQQISIINAETEAQKTIIASQAMATKRAQEGYTYQQERGFDVAEQVARNEAVGQFTNLGVGLGTMAGVGGAIGGVVGSAVNNSIGSNINMPVNHSNNRVCNKCGLKVPENSKFCLNCGEKILNPSEELIICKSCGKQTLKGKFCMECGAVLANKCPNCGLELASNAKFCLNCGQKL